MKADHSIEYFMTELDRISDKDYIPTDKDILLQVSFNCFEYNNQIHPQSTKTKKKKKKTKPRSNT